MTDPPRTFDELYNYIIERDVIDMITKVHIPEISGLPMTALVDSGNGAYNVIHGTNITRNKGIGGQPGINISFKTVNGKIRTFKTRENIEIHIGSGEKEIRPVIKADITIEGKRHKDVKFSVADRSENEHPVLLGVDFIQEIGALIDVSDETV
tara:strand:- start:21126 stop:21584 length:459 start_codon:yes stop_codon:yes gene_type:complete